MQRDSSSMWTPSRTIEHSRLLGGEKASLAASQSGNDFSRAFKPVTSWSDAALPPCYSVCGAVVNVCLWHCYSLAYAWLAAWEPFT